MKLIVANWKMNPDSPREAGELAALASRLAKKLRHSKLVLCPPAIYLAPLLKYLSPRLSLGAQNCFSEVAGAHTGEISAPMLRKLGIDYVILGHSERRAGGENDEVVNKKVRLALKEGRKVIVCVGEHERDSHGQYLIELKTQIQNSLAKLGAAGWKNLIIAYEPVWAVGTGAKAADTPAGFLESALFIRRVVTSLVGRRAAFALPILYGGSVEAKNAALFTTVGQADGLLIGRASLNGDEFKKIIKLVDES